MIAVFKIGVCIRLVHAIAHTNDGSWIFADAFCGVERTSKPRDLWALLILCELEKSQCKLLATVNIANTAKTFSLSACQSLLTCEPAIDLADNETVAWMAGDLTDNPSDDVIVEWRLKYIVISKSIAPD